ncbi:MAG: DUF998 domain-containing protein [Erysipelotrichaceae bacterium]
MFEKRLRYFGIFGIISLLSYSAMVVFSPLAYPGYDWISMAVSELSAVGAPSEKLANQLNCLFGPCGLVSIMAVCLAMVFVKSRVLKNGVYLFAAMEWVCSAGYTMFPWSENVFQNTMHLIVTVLVVVLSIVSLILIGIGARKEELKSLSVWAFVCLFMMLMGPLGMNLFPSLFGIFERFSTFSAVIFNCILGIYLLMGKFSV